MKTGSQDNIKKHSIDDEKYYSPDFYKYVSYEVGKEYFPLIGEFISVFNSLEDALSEELIDYLENDKMPNIGWIIISEMSYISKVYLWEKLLSNVGHYPIDDETTKEKKQKETFIKRVENTRKELAELGEIRNCIAHGNWQYMNTSYYVKTKTKADKKGIIHQHLEIKKDEFGSLIERVEKAEEDFLKFNNWFKKEIELDEIDAEKKKG